MSTARRYTAADMKKMAILLHYAGAGEFSDEAASMLTQASHTEADVRGLVEALEDVLKFSNDPAVIRMTRDALSKFRGD